MGFFGTPGNPFDYAPYNDWQFLLEMQCVYDDAGREELYIVSYGSTSTFVIPEPLTGLAFFFGVAGLAGYVRKRR